MLKPFVLISLLAGCLTAPCLAAPPDVDAITALRGVKLERAIWTIDSNTWTQISRRDLWRLLDALQVKVEPDVPATPGDSSYHSVRFYLVLRELGKRGEAEDLARMIELFGTLPDSDQLRDQLVDPIFQIWVREKLRHWKGPQQPLTFAGTASPLPKELEQAAPELQDAWRYYEQVVPPEPLAPPISRLDYFKGDGKYISIIGNQQAFHHAIGEMLHGKPSSEYLERFVWTEGCGTGRDAIMGPRNRMMFLALWQEERLRDAIRLMLDIHAPIGRSNTNEDWTWRIEFLRRCGIDWEKLAIGSFWHRKWGEEELARYGSDSVARYLADTGRLPSSENNLGLVLLVPAFITPGPAASPEAQLTTFGPRRARQISQTEQLELLEFLHRVAQSKSAWATYALEQICTLRRPESIPLLHEVLNAPENTNRRIAYETLKAMDQPVTEPTELAPAQFQFSVDGSRLGKNRIKWSIHRRDYSVVDGTAQTDEHGILTLPRDAFFSRGATPEEDLQLQRLVGNELSRASNPSPSIQFRNSEDAPQTILRFDRIIPLTPDFGVPANIDIQCTPVDLFTTGDGIFPLANGEVPIARVQVQRASRGSGGTQFEACPPNRSVTFGKDSQWLLESDRYRFVIDMPGARHWVSEPLDLTGTRRVVEARLEPGADLKFSALAPGGENRDRFVEAQIWRNGKRLDLSQQYDYDARTYRGLPLGKYEVRILSSAEQAAGRKWSETISSPPYAGRTIKVTLDGQTPLVDLGQIQLEPVRQP